MKIKFYFNRDLPTTKPFQRNLFTRLRGCKKQIKATSISQALTFNGFTYEAIKNEAISEQYPALKH